MPKPRLYAGTMTLEDAAAALRISVDATESEIQRAFKLRARDSHPDLVGGFSPERGARSAEDFIRITAARDTLLKARRLSTAAAQAAPESTARPRHRRISWQAMAAWLSVVIVAAFVSIGGAELPFTVLTVGLVGFALTGKQVYFVLIALAIVVTAVLAIIFTTLGALLGMFILSAPVIGLVLAGRAQRASDRRLGNQPTTSQTPAS